MGLRALVEATYNNAGTGIRVNRVAAPDAVGPTNLFTIQGGLVQVTGLIGIVTVLRAGAAATTVFSHSTGPTLLCVATPTVASPVGTVFSITGDPFDGLIVGIGTTVLNTFPPIQGGMKGSGLGGVQQFGLYCGVGTITTTISFSTAGSTRYILTYIPLDDGATVVPA